MLITLWITQRENAYVEIDNWHCNRKQGEPLLAALEAATSPLRFLFRATTCYDHLRRQQLRHIGIEDLLNWKRSPQQGCLHCEVTSFWEHLDGDVLLPSVLYFKQLAIFRRAWEDPIERISIIARRWEFATLLRMSSLRKLFARILISRAATAQ
jgi:hypothetical protein